MSNRDRITAEDVVASRQSVHGDFESKAEFIQHAKEHFRALARNSGTFMSAPLVEAIDNILQKIGRIATGNAREVDHWVDIQGYALLAQRHIELQHPTEPVEINNEYMAPQECSPKYRR